MDYRNKITYKMIETAVDKGIRDIKENSNRGVRNLLDLGNHLTSGSFQKTFFKISLQILNNQSSPYYDLVNYTVNNVDQRILKHFGINLGYNCWTYGAKKIREYEKKHGYNIPWTVIFDFKNENKLSDMEVSKILDSGEAMGIYCGMFFAENNADSVVSLITTLKAHRDSSYFIFLNPELITNRIASLIADAGNITVVLKINSSENNSFIPNAIAILADKKCLYGIYSTYNDDTIEYFTSNSFLSRLEELHCTFAYLIRQSLNSHKNIEYFRAFMQSARNDSKYRVFIADFYDDLANIDKVISVENCFLKIKGDGSITISKDLILEGLNIKTHSLQAILKQAMPKTQYILP